MKALPLVRIAAAAALVAGIGVARAEAATPQQIQAQITNGQASTAVGELNTILQAHPDSGVAWFLSAEAQDAIGNEAAARGALAKADQLAPGLPFAQANQVSALRAHLAAAPATAVPAGGMGISPVAIGIGALVVLFILIRMFMRSRRTMAPQMYANGGVRPGYQNGPPAPYGQGGMAPFGGGMGMGGGGIGGSLMGGLAAGAGLAAGERAIDGLMGGGGGRMGEPTQGEAPPAEPPARDDGLMGSPGWNDNSGGGGADPNDNGGNFDPNNSW